jgi:hypothetical protein
LLQLPPTTLPSTFADDFPLDFFEVDEVEGVAAEAETAGAEDMYEANS